MTIYVFCPEEPELHIQAAGAMHHFKNGRLVFEDENAAAVGELRAQDKRFVVTDDLASVGVPLYERVIASMSRKADASNPAQIVRDAKFMFATMTRQGDDDVVSPGTMSGDMAVIARTMPQTVGEDLKTMGYSDQQRADADAAAIEAGAGEGTPDEVKPEEPENLPDSFSPPQEPSSVGTITDEEAASLEGPQTPPEDPELEDQVTVSEELLARAASGDPPPMDTSKRWPVPSGKSEATKESQE